MALQNIRRKGAALAAVIGVGTLVVAGCARDTVDGTHVAAGAPLTVACEQNQRAVVRQVSVNGSLQSQVQCETVVLSALANGGAPAGFVGASPVAYQPGVQPVSTVSYVPLDNTRMVRTAYPQDVVVRDVAPRRVTPYQRAPERRVIVQPKRSVKKSAIIIGSSAGVGAGIGAAVGGKKGAGIGALLGGGGAALWDQLTRRKQ